MFGGVLSVSKVLRAATPVIVGGMAMFAATTAQALPQFTLSPSAIGAIGVADFTADNLLLSDYTTINFTPGMTAGTSNFTEVGTLAVNNAQIGNAQPVDSGLNSTYGLYFSFSASGTQTDFTASLSSGSFTMLSFSLYGYTKGIADTVTYTADNATPGGVTNATLLATGALSSGGVTIMGGNPSANATTTFDVVFPGFFVAPVPFYNLALSAFTNTSSQVSGSQQSGQIVITQGGGVANFASVPEPMSITLLGFGLMAAVFASSRTRKS